MNHSFWVWDDVGGEVKEFTLPADCQKIMQDLPSSTPSRVFMDLADVWRAEEVENEIGNERTHITLDNGTHLLVATWGRGQQYGIAWHPSARDQGQDAIIALGMGGEGDESDPEEARLLPLAQEIDRKLNAAS